MHAIQPEHDRVDPWVLGHAEELGALEGVLRGEGLHGSHASLPGFDVEVEALRADPTPIEQLQVPEIIDMLENMIGKRIVRRSSWGTRRVVCSPRSCSITASVRLEW